MYQKKWKRYLDLFMATFLGIILLPVFILIAVWIKLDSEGSVLFIQNRVGIHKKIFKIYKFRTMYTSAPKNCPTHQLSAPDSYITKAGAFLRKTSLDEIPQLWNIIKGDMSFVGPRPALWNQKDLILEREKYGANNILPGLTGWAQIHGRDELEIEEKARLDGFYVKRGSFSLDLFCLLKTVGCVLRKEGVVEGGTNQKYSAYRKP